MIRLAIRRPVAVSMAYLAVALLGVAAWRNIPIELLPDTKLPRLFVQATWWGASPETTEALLTSPLEAAIQQVRGVEKIESQSFEENGRGQARITVEFSRGTDMDFARLELSERLAAIDDELPAASTRPLVSGYLPREFQEQQRPFLEYTLSGPYTLEALRAHVEDVIIPDLAQVDGVANVTASGGRKRILEIELDESRVQSLRLDLEDVRRRIAELEYVRQAGYIKAAGTLRSIAIRERAGSADEVRRLPLLTDGGRMVRLQDVSSIHDTYEEALAYYRIDGQPAVSFTVFKEAGTNAVAVADRVKERLADLDALHPPGVRIILDEDESEAIRAQLTDLRFRALVAACVIFLVLLLFLGSVRSAAIIFATIGFSILITLNLIYFGGYTLNVLTLMGLAMGFGLIVDNAIVVLENIYRLRRRGEPAAVAAERGAREVVLAILAATLTTIVVLVPFVYLQGELRVFYVPLAIVVGFSLLASLFVAFTFIPALAGRILGNAGGATPPDESQSRRGGEHGHAGAGGQTGPDVHGSTELPGGPPPHGRKRPLYERIYAGMIGLTLRIPLITVILGLAALGGSYYVFDKYVTRGVLWGRWGGQDTYISIQIRLPRGEELARTDELARFFEQKLLATPEVRRFVTNVRPQYADIRATFPDSLNLTQVPVVIKEQMVAYSHQFGGADVRVYGYGPSFYGGGGSPPNYSIKVLGYNYEMVRQIGEDLATRLRRFSRIRDVDANAAGSWFDRDKATELVLRVDRRRLALHDLTARDLVFRVAAAVRGEARGAPIQLDGDEVELAIKLEGNRDLDLLGLQNLLLPTPRGQNVRLADVATLEERQVLSRIIREDQQYQRNVSYEFRGPTKLGDQVHQAVIASTGLPPGYKLEARQEWRWSEDEQEQIYGVLAVSLILIFMVTAALFESLRQPLCVLLTVPMALIGVFMIFFYANATFTREAYIGVIMMGGIVVNNAILLIDHVNQLRRRDGMALEAAIRRGAIERVRPILMTSATTILGLLPLVLFSESTDSNIWNALGYALIGGLTSSTVLVLTVTPALYLIFERRPERRRLARAGATAAILAGAFAFSGCGADSRPSVIVERSDSAGIAIVRNRGADVPLAWSFTPTLTLGGEDEGPESFFGIGPASITADPAGNLYVLDNGNHRVVVFGPDGEHLRTLGRQGGGPGEFQFWPRGIALDADGSVNVYDLGKHGLVRFAADGSVLPTRRIDLPSMSGRFTISDRLLMEAVASGGQDEPRYDQIVAIGPEDDTTVVASFPQQAMKAVDFGCVRISGMPRIFVPTLQWTAAAGRVLVVATEAYAIDVYEEGRHVGSIRRDVMPRAATRELALRQVGEKFEVKFGGGGSCVVQPEKVIDEQGVAEVIPTIGAIAVAPDGTIWIHRFAVRGDDAAVDLLAPDGTYLGTLPSGSPFPAAFLPDGRIAVLEKDDLDVQRIVAYRVDGAGPEGDRSGPRRRAAGRS